MIDNVLRQICEGSATQRSFCGLVGGSAQARAVPVVLYNYPGYNKGPVYDRFAVRQTGQDLTPTTTPS